MGQVPMFGFGAPLPIGPLGVFDANGAQGSDAGIDLPWQTPAPLQLLAHPQAGAMAPPDQSQVGGKGRGRQDADKGALASLLHGDRRAEHFQSTRMPQGCR